MGTLSQLPKFLFVGLANTLVALLIIFTAKAGLEMGDASANALGYAVGLLLSFTLNRRWTFRHSGSVTRSLPVFLTVQAVAYLFNLLSVLWLIAQGMDAYGAQVCGILPYTAISFLGSRFLAFRSRDTKTLP